MSSPPKNPSTQLLSLKKVAARLDVSISTVRRLHKSRALPALMIGGQLRITISDLQSFIDSSYSEPSPLDEDDDE